MQCTFLEHDLGSAAYLWATGHEFIGLVQLHNNRCVFEFAEDSAGSCANASREYWEGALVCGETIIHCLHQLKSKLRQFKVAPKEDENHAIRKVLRTSH